MTSQDFPPALDVPSLARDIELMKNIGKNAQQQISGKGADNSHGIPHCMIVASFLNIVSISAMFRDISSFSRY